MGRALFLLIVGTTFFSCPESKPEPRISIDSTIVWYDSTIRDPWSLQLHDISMMDSTEKLIMQVKKLYGRIEIEGRVYVIVVEWDCERLWGVVLAPTGTRVGYQSKP